MCAHYSPDDAVWITSLLGTTALLAVIDDTPDPATT